MRAPERGILGTIAAFALAWGSMGALAESSETVNAVMGVTPEGDTCFIGGSAEGVFVEPAELMETLRSGSIFTLVDLAGADREVAAVGPPSMTMPGGDCEAHYTVQLALEAGAPGRFVAAFLGGRSNIATRLPSRMEIHEKDATVRAALAEHLQESGLEDPVIAVKQVIVVDLDRDGGRSIIINAVRDGGGEQRRGDYSVMLLHEPAGVEGSRTIPIYSDIVLEDEDYVSTVLDNTIVAIADISGDGLYELIVYGSFAFGDGWEVIRIDGDEVEGVLGCGCGG